MFSRVMEWLSERNQVRSVLKRWNYQYRDYQSDPADMQRKQGVRVALTALDVETATAEDVAAVIGNKGWVCPPVCSECRNESYDAVAFSDDDASVCVCISCLQAATALILLGNSK